MRGLSMHWRSGETRVRGLPGAGLRFTYMEFKPLCGRWMVDSGQFAEREEQVTCIHCKNALKRMRSASEVVDDRDDG